MKKPFFSAPAAQLERKPPHGSPCNRCGLCCVATLCPLGRFVFGRERGPCPALSYDAEGLSLCGLVADPMRHAMKVAVREGAEKAGAAAKQLIGAGTGCDARFNGEPVNKEFYDELREWDRRTATETRRAQRTWGLR